ncbi:MAG: zinc transporter ZntB [Paracoccaceae bacterium]
MDVQRITPLAAFDFERGVARAVENAWPEHQSDKDYRWLHLDLEDPISAVWIKDQLPQIAAISLLQKETRPRCERHGNGLILNLRAVNLNPQSAAEDMVSLRMWVTPNSVVSAHIRKVFAIDAIRQKAEQGSGPSSVGQFLGDLTYGLMSRIDSVSLELEERTDELEEQVSEGVALDPRALGEIRQTVIKLRRFVNPQREAIAALADIYDWPFTVEERGFLRETSNRTRRVVEELDATRDRLSTLQDQLEAERTNTLSRNSYILSVVAAIFLPLGFLTGLFGVNVAGMPGTEHAGAFWILVGFSVVVGGALYLIFKFSKWL